MKWPSPWPRLSYFYAFDALLCYVFVSFCSALFCQLLTGNNTLTRRVTSSASQLVTCQATSFTTLCGAMSAGSCSGSDRSQNLVSMDFPLTLEDMKTLAGLRTAVYDRHLASKDACYIGRTKMRYDRTCNSSESMVIYVNLFCGEVGRDTLNQKVQCEFVQCHPPGSMAVARLCTQGKNLSLAIRCRQLQLLILLRTETRRKSAVSGAMCSYVMLCGDTPYVSWCQLRLWKIIDILWHASPVDLRSIPNRHQLRVRVWKLPVNTGMDLHLVALSCFHLSCIQLVCWRQLQTSVFGKFFSRACSWHDYYTFRPIDELSIRNMLSDCGLFRLPNCCSVRNLEAACGKVCS